MKTLAIVLLMLPIGTCGTTPEPVEVPADLASGSALETMCQQAVTFMEGERWDDEVPNGPAIQISWCAGYVLGLKDTVGVVSAQAGLFCAPTSVTTWELIQPIVDYAARHPESQGLHRSALAIQAWSEAFPCSGDSSSRHIPRIET